MRVTSEFWVSALVRRVFADGGFAAVARRGAREAGAIYVLRRTRLGEIELYGPAPQTAYEEARPDERCFIRLLQTLEQAEIDKRLEREARFDADLWVVELEIDGALEAYVPVIADQE